MKKSNILYTLILTGASIAALTLPFYNDSEREKKPIPVYGQGFIHDEKQNPLEREQKLQEKKERVLRKLNKINVNLERFSEKMREKTERLEEKTAKYAVKNYLNGVYAGEYKEAYNYLSQDSKKIHSYNEFVKQNKKGIAFYDLNSAKSIRTEKGIEVMLQMYGDPASHSIFLKKEGPEFDSEFKIIWHQGTPSFPYR